MVLNVKPIGMGIGFVVAIIIVGVLAYSAGVSTVQPVTTTITTTATQQRTVTQTAIVTQQRTVTQMVTVTQTLTQEAPVQIPSEAVPSLPLDVKLELSGAPRLDETAELRCVVMSIFKASEVTVYIRLPDGFVLVDGSSSWVGDIPAGGSVELVVIIKAVNVGNWTIEAKAGYYRPSGCWYGDTDRIYISVSE